jgi:hypothetical protein
MLPPIRVAPFLIALLLVVLGNSKAGAQPEASGVIYDSGFYNEESLKDQSWRWMDAEGVVKLKNGRQDMILKITGRAPVDAIPGELPTMKIFLNGEQLEQFTAADKIFEKEYKVSAAKLGNGIWSELKITTNKVIVPSQVNKKSTDDRHLGFKLYGLTWLTAAGAPAEQIPEPDLAVPVEAAPPAKGWLAAIILVGLGMTLLFAITVGAWLYLRQRRGPVEPVADKKQGRSRTPR